MIYVIILFNLIIGYKIRLTVERHQSHIRKDEHRVFAKFLLIGLILLMSMTYITHLFCIYSEEYKYAMCMLIICYFSVVGLNLSVYSNKNCEE